MDNFRDSLIIRSEITIKTLMTKVLSKWRCILLGGFLLAIIAGSYSYYSQRKAVLQWKEPADTSTVSAGPSIPDYTNVRERTLRAIYDKSNYFDNSLYLRLDPSEFWKAAVDVYVKTDELKEEELESAAATGQNMSPALRNANRILDHYCQYLNHGVDYGEIAGEFDTTAPFISELIGVGSQDKDIVRIVISISYFNREGAQKMLDFVINKLQSHYENAVQDFGEHELIFINENCRLAADTGGLSNAVSTRASEFNALMKQYNDLKTNENNLDLSKVKIAEKPTVSRKKALKLSIAGFIAGIILSAVAYILRYSMGAKVLSARDFNIVYGLKKIGVIPNKKQRRMGMIDKKILSSELRYQRESDPEKGYELAERNIKSLVKGKTIAVVSDLSNDKIEAVLEHLKNTNTEIDYRSVGDLSDPSGEKDLAECDNVLIIAETMKSRYDIFDDIMQSIAHTDKNILGSIVI